MADDNLKDFTLSWILLGLLSFCLMTFATTFMFANNPSYGFGEENAEIFGIFENCYDDHC